MRYRQRWRDGAQVYGGFQRAGAMSRESSGRAVGERWDERRSGG